ncbi:unnamed protein product [Cercospora beticola]|nr:unnamed protein product [Cercospora beticola]
MADSNSSNNGDSLDLRRHIENLPQELYDRIYDLTFTATPKVRVYCMCADTREYLRLDRQIAVFSAKLNISVNEKLPHLLHVDRCSREKFAKSYFGHPGSIFIFCGIAPNQICIQSSHFDLIPVLRSFAKRGRSHWGVAALKGEMIDEGWMDTTVEKFEFLYFYEFTRMLGDIHFAREFVKHRRLQ